MTYDTQTKYYENIQSESLHRQKGVILLCYLSPVNILFLLWLIPWSNTACHYGNDVYRLDHSITKTQKAILKAFDIDSNDAKAKINDLSMRLGYRTR